VSAQDKPQAELMKLDFSIFLMSLIESAHIHLGDVPGPDGQVSRDLELAHHNIELLALLEEKTKGNLTGPEESLLMRALDELRQRFADASKES
jgi:Domain of unknown function (DUF1844)